MGFNLNDYNYGVQKVHDLMQEVWNNGYDEGQSFGVKEVLDALRAIIKWEGGISQEVIDIILNAEYNEVQEYADALEREIHIGDEISFRALDYMDEGESANGVVLHTWKAGKYSGFDVYSPSEGFHISDDLGDVRKTGRHFDIENILESIRK